MGQESEVISANQSTALSEEAYAQDLHHLLVANTMQSKGESTSVGGEKTREKVGIYNATLIDARGLVAHAWVISVQSVIVAQGFREDEWLAAREFYGLRDEDVIDAQGQYLTPGYIDIHAHGGWACAFDDGEEAILRARACHMWHGTTRQVLSLITNPLEVLQSNLQQVKRLTDARPDIIGAHLEGPFLALARKGAHEPAYLLDPRSDYVEKLIESADGCLRQITLAVEREHGMEALKLFVEAGVHVAVGHTDADYETAKRAFDAGADVMTHMFDAMNGLHHRNPGPITAALEDPRVHLELINDGFHVVDPMLKLAFNLAKDRIALVTDAMSATGCPDGKYLLGSLAVDVVEGKARLTGTTTIAGSTLVLEESVRRAVCVLGLSPVEAIRAVTLTPARALGLDKTNEVTACPLGLLAPGYAADMLLLDRDSWLVQAVWVDGRKAR